MDLCNIDELRRLLARHGFHFSKSMGQNFLVEPWAPRDIAAACGGDLRHAVLEIGPGVGTLTRELSPKVGKVVAVELDRALLPVLAETVGESPNVEVVPGDIMKLDLDRLVAEKFSGYIPLVCANLPYNITTPVITKLLESKQFEAVTVMIQREVAKRICAQPGSGDYGAFSVFCQYHARCDYRFEVGPECFLPAPKVTSAVVTLTPQPKPKEVEDEAAFFRVTRAAFAQRRKTLLNCLSAAYGNTFTKDALRELLVRCGFSEDVRGERLGIPEFARLAKALSEPL